MHIETQEKLTYSPTITSDVSGKIKGYVTNVVYMYSKGILEGIQFGYEYVDESGESILVDAD